MSQELNVSPTAMILFPFWWLFFQVVAAGANRCAKLQSNDHHQQTNTSYLQLGCPSCHPTNSVKAQLQLSWTCPYIYARQVVAYWVETELVLL